MFTAVGISADMDSDGVATFIESLGLPSEQFEDVDGAQLLNMKASELKKRLGVKEGIKMHARMSQYRAMALAYTASPGPKPKKTPRAKKKPKPKVIPKEEKMEIPKLQNIISLPGTEEKGCRICGGEVIDELGLTVENNIYHPECFLCTECGAPVNGEMLAVHNKFYHVKCMMCHHCFTPLAGNKFMMDKEFHLYCNDHMHSKSRRFPHCPGCSEQLDERLKTLKAMDVIWHVKCFKCCVCSDPLEGNFYTRAGGQPTGRNLFCQKCYHAQFGGAVSISSTKTLDSVCGMCYGKFVAKREYVKAKSQGGKHLYFHPHCFKCAFPTKNFIRCPTNINKKFFIFEDKPYCELHIDIVDPQSSETESDEGDED